MKIAILASENGEKALYVHQFFKEGNRVEIDCLITDRENSSLTDNLNREGIPTYYYAAGEWSDGEEILRLLRERGVEIVMVDGLDREVPGAVASSYGEAVFYPTDVESSPAEVVALYNKLTKGSQQKKKKEKEKNENPTMEEEWAETLKIHYDEEEAKEAAAKAVPPPYDEGATPPPVESGEAPGVIPVSSQTPPRQEESSYWQGVQNVQPQRQNEPENREPMPNTYLIWSVLATIFCCLIPGIVAIIMSSSVSTKYFNGDIEGAKRASRRAEIWIIVSIISGIIWFSLYLPMALLSS